MELQIQDLISSIKKDGIDAAQKESEEIISAANQKASEIIEEAKAQASAMVSDAEQKIRMLKSGADENAKQAQRDALLLFKSSVENEYKKILSANIKKTVNGEALGRLIKAALSGEDPAQYAAEVSEVSEGLKAELAKEITDGLELKLSTSVKSGFRLASKDGSGYFDCSDEEIAEMLKPFFSDLNF